MEEKKRLQVRGNRGKILQLDRSEGYHPRAEINREERECLRQPSLYGEDLAEEN